MNQLAVHDNVAALNGIIVHYYQPVRDFPNPGAGGFIAPAQANCFVLIRYENKTFGLQSINNLTPL